jgi:ferredoxin-NADP reductase
MPDFDTEFVKRAAVAEGTMAFEFVKPERFDFQAGQSLALSLIDPPETDAKGNQRIFSIASAPSDDRITIATRMRDTAFKRTLKAMPAFTRVRIRGPSGRFTLESDDHRPAVMLAGGIGITPFRSMLRHAVHERLARDLYLIFSNRNPRDAPFLREVMELEGLNGRYRFVGTMTAMNEADRSWPGNRGYVDADMLARHVPDMRDATYYIAGPPVMVAAMRAMLARAGVAAELIRNDQFFGY